MMWLIYFNLDGCWCRVLTLLLLFDFFIFCYKADSSHNFRYIQSVPEQRVFCLLSNWDEKMKIHCSDRTMTEDVEVQMSEFLTGFCDHLGNKIFLIYLKKKWTLNFSLRTNMKLKKKQTQRTLGLGCLHAATAICMCGTPKYDSVQITPALFFIVLIGQGCVFFLNAWLDICVFLFELRCIKK